MSTKSLIMPKLYELRTFYSIQLADAQNNGERELTIYFKGCLDVLCRIEDLMLGIGISAQSVQYPEEID